MKRSKQWASNERMAAKVLGGKRISRGADFGQSVPDIELPGLPQFRLDHKRRKRFLGRTLLEEVKRKYCKEKGDIAVVIVKEHLQRSATVLLDLHDFKKLLDFYPHQ